MNQTSSQVSFRVPPETFEELERRGRISGQGPHQEAKRLLLEAIQSQGSGNQFNESIASLREQLETIQSRNIGSEFTQAVTSLRVEIAQIAKEYRHGKDEILDRLEMNSEQAANETAIRKDLKRLNHNLKKLAMGLLVAAGDISAEDARKWVDERLR